jgi:hypothetical protein
MLRRLAVLALPLLLLTAAAKKNSAPVRGENQDLILTVTLYTDAAAIKDLLGSDLEGHYIVADVKVEPKYGKEIAVDRDEFQLRSFRDGEMARPFAASQIAGRGALVISNSGTSRTGGGISMGSPMDYPGNYPVGYPGGGNYPPPGSGAAMGTGGGDGGEVTASVRNAARDKENPLEKVLADKILPDRKTDQPFSGLLYFPLEKQKLKDLELTYGKLENKIRLRFK